MVNNKVSPAIKVTLNHPSNAPKDEVMFLGDFGHDILLMTCWDHISEGWLTPILEGNVSNDGYCELFFQGDREDESALIGWIHLPTKAGA